MNGRVRGLSLILGLCVVGSALAVVYTKHHSRRLFVELQALQADRDRLDIEWGKLLLEQSAWATPSRVEDIARRKLRMHLPAAGQVEIIRP